MRYSIKSILRKDKAVKLNGCYPINFQLQYLGKHFKISAGKEVLPEFWNATTCRVKESCGEAQNINYWLETEENRFRDYMQKQELLGNNNVTVEEIQALWKKEKPVLMSKDFYVFYEDQVKLWSGTLRIRTLENYHTTLSVLKQFKPKVSFNDLSHDFLERFENYLRTDRGNSTGGVFNRLKCLKAVIYSAIKKEEIQNNPFKYYKIKNAPSRITFLTIEELKALENLELDKRCDGQIRTRDFFLFSAYTGLRFADVTKLEKQNIQNGTVVCKMEKTGKKVTIPLTKKAIEIIDKYSLGNNKNITLFPISNNKRTNLNLRELSTKIGLTKKLTFHIARHTFASTHVALGTHLIVLKELMGHSSIEQTEIYAKADFRQLEASMEKFNRLYCTN